MSSSGSSDRQAFEQLLRPHLKRLYRLAYRLTGSTHDAEDLLQNVLVKLYRRRDELTSIEELSPWLGRVLYNQFVDDNRRYARQRLRVVSDHGNPANADPDTFASDTRTPEADADREFHISRLQAALEHLSEDHRQVVLLHDSEGYKLAEIQRITGTPVGTLKSRLHRARARLRELLDPDGTF